MKEIVIEMDFFCHHYLKDIWRTFYSYKKPTIDIHTLNVVSAKGFTQDRNTVFEADA